MAMERSEFVSSLDWEVEVCEQFGLGFVSNGDGEIGICEQFGSIIGKQSGVWIDKVSSLRFKTQKFGGIKLMV